MTRQTAAARRNWRSGIRAVAIANDDAAETRPSPRINAFGACADASFVSAPPPALARPSRLMSADVTTDIAALSLVLFALVLGGWLGALVDAPLVGEIVVGVALGPSGLDLVPHADAFVLAGNLALALLVMEGGMSVDVSSLRRVGPLATAIAVAGTLLPIGLGCAYMLAAGFRLGEGVASGVALSSTSIGMATRLMQTVGELDTPLGSLVCVAAMVDDVLSLVILAVVGNVRGASGAGALAWRASRPALVSALVCVAGVAAFGLCPPTFAAARTRIPTTLHGRAALLFAFAVTLGLTVAAGEAGSTHLLGAFAGGVAFASVDDAKTQWARNEAFAAWAYSVFFLSVGMQIPLSALFEARGVGLGVGYAVPAVLGKLATALFFANRRDVADAEEAGNRFVDAADDEGPSSDANNNDARRKSRRRFCSCVSLSPDAFVVGWAMVGRGELGFVMARQAREEGLIGPEPYVASCWALLIATLVAPPLMRRALDARRRKRDAAGAAAGGRGTASSGDASGRAGDSNDRGSNDGAPSGARSNDDPVGERTRGWRLGGLI